MGNGQIILLNGTSSSGKSSLAKALQVVLERRELERGNRKIGLARFQYPNIHIHGAYDIEVDTELYSSQACARQIKEKVKAGQEFTKFHEAQEKPLPD